MNIHYHYIDQHYFNYEEMLESKLKEGNSERSLSEIVKILLDHYYCTCLRNLREHIPKITLQFLMKPVQDEMRNYLMLRFTQIEVEELLKEDPEIIMRRNHLSEIKNLLTNARKILNSDTEISAFIRTEVNKKNMEREKEDREKKVIEAKRKEEELRVKMDEEYNKRMEKERAKATDRGVALRREEVRETSETASSAIKRTTVVREDSEEIKFDVKNDYGVKTSVKPKFGTTGESSMDFNVNFDSGEPEIEVNVDPLKFYKNNKEAIHAGAKVAAKHSKEIGSAVYKEASKNKGSDPLSNLFGFKPKK